MQLIPPREFERIAAAELDADARLELLADMCRLNALVAVKRAGSGHLGSTFSSLDLVAHLLWENLNVAEVGFDSPDRDVFFSSKGHDVPGLYAALNALGVIPTERLLRLRRLGGLDGHPDVGVPGIEANSGSLGMGISKARGIAWAKRHLGRGGRVVVMTGDGELQEGQNWEALQAAAHQRVGRLLVVVDRNELQSDKATEEILALESLEAKLRAFGCRVVTCDGHDHAALRHALREALGATTTARPASSSRGRSRARASRSWSTRGRSPRAAARTAGTRARPTTTTSPPRPASSRPAARADRRRFGLAPLALERRSAARRRARGQPPGRARERRRRARRRGRASPRSTSPPPTGRRCSSSRRASRVSSCSTPTSPPTAACARSSSRSPTGSSRTGSPSRTWSRWPRAWPATGSLPVVNSFASFLASRANEQIYNQASERTKVVYAMHYAGLIPAGPGKSHQSLRDASLMAAIPGVTVVHPCNGEETRALVEWAVLEATESVAIRLAIGPSPRRIELPAGLPARAGRRRRRSARAATRCSSRTGP